MPEERRSTRTTEERGRQAGKEEKGAMTVEEAGHLGGRRVSELVAEGKKLEAEEGKMPESESKSRTSSKGRGAEEGANR
jgi:hypothetical protein